MKSYSRIDRINELIKEEISLIIKNRLKDPRLGFLTVLNVITSKDLALSKIYVSIYGDNETKDKTMEALMSATGFIRGELGSRIRLRCVPEIVFIQDESEDIRFRIDGILKEIKNNNPSIELS